MGEGNKNEAILSRDEVLQVVRNHLKTSDFTLEHYEIKPASDNLLGFLGEHTKILAAVRAGGQTQQLSYFVKKIPTAVPSHHDYALKTRAFYKEIEMYKTFMKDLESAQAGAEPERKWCPEYYFSRAEELIVVEDLSVLGCYMYPERRLMDEDHLRAALEAMAAMHAAAFALEEKLNTGQVASVTGFRAEGKGRVTIGDVYPQLNFETEVSDIAGHPGNTFYEVGIKALMELLPHLEGYTEAERDRVRQALPARVRRVMQMVKPSDKYKNIMIHGDLWANNLMFRRGESGQVEQAVLVDFQLARYAPPGHELTMLLHLCQDRAFRRQHEAALLRHYHAGLTRGLARHGLTPEAVGLSWDTLLDSYGHYQEYGVLTTALYFQVIFLSPEITAKFFGNSEMFERNMLVDRSELVLEQFLSDPFVRTRLGEVLDVLIKEFILA